MKTSPFCPVDAFRAYLSLSEFVDESGLSRSCVLSRVRRGKIQVCYAEGSSNHFHNRQLKYPVWELPPDCGSRYLIDWLTARASVARAEALKAEEELDAALFARRVRGAA